MTRRERSVWLLMTFILTRRKQCRIERSRRLLTVENTPGRCRDLQWDWSTEMHTHRFRLEPPVWFDNNEGEIASYLYPKLSNPASRWKVDRSLGSDSSESCIIRVKYDDSRPRSDAARRGRITPFRVSTSAGRNIRAAIPRISPSSSFDPGGAPHCHHTALTRPIPGPRSSPSTVNAHSPHAVFLAAPRFELHRTYIDCDGKPGSR